MWAQRGQRTATGPTLVAAGPTGTEASPDEGEDWHPLGTDGFNAVGFAGPHAGWAVGDDGAIARFLAEGPGLP